MTEDLVAWIEYSNPSIFKSKVLSKLHSDRFVEWDRDVDSVTLSPKGAKYVEETLLNHNTKPQSACSAGKPASRP